MREEIIKSAIESMPDKLFERFAVELLRRELYPGLNPTSESHDLGEDARTEQTTVFLHNGQRVSVLASKTANLSKIRKDCQRCKETGRHIDIVVFITSGNPRTKTENTWRQKVKQKFSWDLEVWTISWLAPVAARPEHESLVNDYLNIPPPDGDFVQNIEVEFSRHTDLALNQIVPLIQGIDNSIPRKEVAWVEDQLGQGRPVVLTGEAGSGKSGIALELIQSARRQGMSTFLLDARRVGYIQNEGQLRQHFTLKGPIDAAIERMRRYKGKKFRFVVDQMDNTAGSLSAQLLIQLVAACCKLEGVEIVVVSRKREAHEVKLLNELFDAGFVELTSHALDETRVLKILAELHISQPSHNLVKLSSNLLNLSLIADIKHKQPAFDFSTILDEIDLWEQYIQVLIDRESLGSNLESAEAIIAEAIRLARLGLNDENRSFRLNFPRPYIQKRLDSWDIIVCESGDVYRFRHEKLQDFLYAWGACRQGLLPTDVLDDLTNIHRTRNVLQWMDKIYSRHYPDRLKDFLKDLLSNSKVPFYTQTSILDRYIHFLSPGLNSEVLKVILDVLQTQPELRRYFFRSRPHAVWAPVLWQAGFFDVSPDLQKVKDNYLIPRWDAQEYLLSVAEQVPEIVIQHIKSIKNHKHYAARAIQALCLIPAEKAEIALPQIVELLEDQNLAFAIAPRSGELLEKFAKEGRIDTTLLLFRLVTTPIPSPYVEKRNKYKFNTQAISILGRDWEQERFISKGVELLAELNPEQLTSILEEHLRTAISLEAETKCSTEFEGSSWWRSAIEDTDQDNVSEYKDHLLKALRDTIEKWIHKDAKSVESLLERYLADKHEILRRLALHILWQFPSDYRAQVIRELRKKENLEDVGIHHEFFMLLKHGYPILDDAGQEELITSICSGPSPEQLQLLIKRAKDGEEDAKEYIEEYSKRWILDRLWMMREHVTGQPAKLLKELIDKVGEPEHPDFTHWLSGVYSITEVSPVGRNKIYELTPDELVSYLKQWKPDPDRQFGPERVTYTGLAGALADVVLAELEKYRYHFATIGLLRHEFANALLNRSVMNDKQAFLLLELRIELCERLLAEGKVCTSLGRNSDENWVEVRKSIVRLLASELEKEQCGIPLEYLPRVQDILIALLDDPDPDKEGDKPKENWIGHDDPSMIALNHVRPMALAALIDSALCMVRLSPGFSPEDEPGPVRLPKAVREALTHKLDRREDPSWAVHSVYGRYLRKLNWLDQEWTASHLDQIFPLAEGEETKRLFVAAWDSFVTYHKNWFYPPFFEMLRHAYLEAIENLSKGHVTSTYLDPEEGLASQLLWEYFLGDYSAKSPIDPESLIVIFFNRVTSSARGKAARWVWLICKDNPDKLEVLFWPKARVLWQWRVQEASRVNYPSDFDEEMQWFAHLLLTVPASESLASLWPILEGLLPYIPRDEYRDMIWESLEKYLSREVESDTVRAIQLYRLMYEQVKEPDWFHYNSREEARKIIDMAAACKESRNEALALINLIARLGDDQYRDIYEKYVEH